MEIKEAKQLARDGLCRDCKGYWSCFNIGEDAENNCEGFKKEVEEILNENR